MQLDNTAVGFHAVPISQPGKAQLAPWAAGRPQGGSQGLPSQTSIRQRDTGRGQQSTRAQDKLQKLPPQGLLPRTASFAATSETTWTARAI